MGCRWGTLFPEVEKEFFCAQKVVGFPMKRRYSELSDGIAVLLGGVSFVALPVILRKLFCQSVHVVIPIGLCQNACSRYRKILPVAFDDGG